ncbi:acetyltransferase [Pseudomonas monteilii]|uniref:Acetyltransferase n=1 Tax=Pseudomonas monteilii TaxID=76759 RepID=A0A2N1IYP9_9PSED|nr:acetyltransferase [Pseudomonas monteilii]PKI25871.1 acetyltransferase [Pseudomonas monteilii]
MKVLAILGASGHGKVIADTAEECGWNKIVFFDDAWPSLQSNGHWSVDGDSQGLIQRLSEFNGVLVAIGNNRARQARLMELAAAGASLVNLIHPRATVSRYAYLGLGTVVFAGAVVNAGVHAEGGAIINTASSVDHDCYLGKAVHLSPGARLAGGVRVGDRSWIGIGAAVRQLIEIGNDVVVGACAAVVSDLPDGVTVVGVPAVPIKN